MTELEFSFLSACHEAISRQQELVPLLAHHLGVKPNEVFYRWVIPPRCKQSGSITDTDWDYFFHGGECDFKNRQDGRFLRIDFGPHGRFDTFSGFGILEFVMASVHPWREFPALRAFLAEEPPPYTELSGSHAKMVALASRMSELKYVEAADPELAKLLKQHTQIQPNGSQLVVLPDAFRDPMQPVFWDIQASGRWVLSQAGKDALASA